MVPTSQGSFDGTRGDMNNHVHVNKTIRAVVTSLINMLLNAHSKRHVDVMGYLFKMVLLSASCITVNTLHEVYTVY